MASSSVGADLAARSICWSNRLSFGLSDEQEAGFHQYNLQIDIKQASVGVLLVILPLILFVFTDYEFHGASTEFAWLVILRVGVVLYCVLQTIIMTRLSDHRAYHRSITIWALVIVAFNLMVNFTQPESLILHSIVVGITVFVLYLVIPNRFSIQIAICTAFSRGRGSDRHIHRTTLDADDVHRSHQYRPDQPHRRLGFVATPCLP